MLAQQALVIALSLLILKAGNFHLYVKWIQMVSNRNNKLSLFLHFNYKNKIINFYLGLI